MLLLLEVLKNDPIKMDGAGFINTTVEEIKGRLTVGVI